MVYSLIRNFSLTALLYFLPVSLNNDLTKISEWAVKWKINFNPDPSKQAQELLFSRKISSKPYPSLNFNDNPVHQVQLQKHLGLFLDQKLSFDEHSQCILIKTHKIIGMIRLIRLIRLIRNDQKDATNHTEGSLVNNL